MDLQLLMEFIRPELLILIVFAWSLGLFLKKAPWFTDEWSIPFILLFICVIFAILYVAIILGEGFTGPVILASTIQGVIIAALAVFGNESIKQYLVKRLEDQKHKGYIKRPRDQLRR